MIRWCVLRRLRCCAAVVVLLFASVSTATGATISTNNIQHHDVSHNQKKLARSVPTTTTLSSVTGSATTTRQTQTYVVPGCEDALDIDAVGATYQVTISLAEQITCFIVTAAEQYCFPDIGSIAYRQWFVYVGEGRSVTIRTDGSGFDTRLSVYEGASCEDSLVCVASHDDGLDSVLSEVTFVASQGTQYYIYAEDYPCSIAENVPVGQTVDFVLSIDYSGDGDNADGSSNTEDLYTLQGCDEAVAVVAGSEFDLRLSLDEALPTCNEFPAVANYCFDEITDVGLVQWYVYVGDGRPVRVSTARSTLDTRISVFSSSGGTSCNDGLLQCVASNDDVTLVDLTSELTFDTALDQTYYILVEDFPCHIAGFVDVGETVRVVLTFAYADATDEELPPTSAPTIPELWTAPGCQDEAVDVVTGSSPAYEKSLASAGKLLTCTVRTTVSTYCFRSLSSVGPNVWLRFVGDGRPVRIHTRGSAYDTRISVYQAASCNEEELICVASNDDISSHLVLSEVLLEAPLDGVEYLVHVDDYPCQAAGAWNAGHTLAASVVIEAVGARTTQAITMAPASGAPPPPTEVPMNT